jgi:hypothetical protein
VSSQDFPLLKFAYNVFNELLGLRRQNQICKGDSWGYEIKERRVISSCREWPKGGDIQWALTRLARSCEQNAFKFVRKRVVMLAPLLGDDLLGRESELGVVPPLVTEKHPLH